MRVKFLYAYVTDQSVVLQLAKLSDLAQGHLQLPSDFLSAGWPTGHARAAPAQGPIGRAHAAQCPADSSAA